MKKLGIFLCELVVLIYAVSVLTVVAQAPPTALTFTAELPFASCQPIAAATTRYCFATDGLYQSINGAAYVKLTPASVGPPAPAVILNGKACGTCTISAAVSVQ